MEKRNLKHADELLRQIAEGLRQHERVRVESIVVTFSTEDGDGFMFGLTQALDAIARDTYWDDRGNWADARTARVDVV